MYRVIKVQWCGVEIHGSLGVRTARVDNECARTEHLNTAFEQLQRVQNAMLQNGCGGGCQYTVIKQ